MLAENWKRCLGNSKKGEHVATNIWKEKKKGRFWWRVMHHRGYYYYIFLRQSPSNPYNGWLPSLPSLCPSVLTVQIWFYSRATLSDGTNVPALAPPYILSPRDVSVCYWLPLILPLTPILFFFLSLIFLFFFF